jgi:hypothetical protein
MCKLGTDYKDAVRKCDLAALARETVQTHAVVAFLSVQSTCNNVRLRHVIHTNILFQPPSCRPGG